MENQVPWTVAGLKLIANGEFSYENDGYTTYQSAALQQAKAAAVVAAFESGVLNKHDAGGTWDQYFAFIAFKDSITHATMLYKPIVTPK